ncbi:hypothetical protein RvY_15933 [Ramazzottius varieornatus]|uniref:Uncharacterized protein n=1 Tax=Ramazzottius varieornatus TaxID=947166 RepID=A0A1D1W4H2_RAMVA|nr:hypothetical protein RvY_15933 [Ramazzottius varieornatus]
MAEIVAPDPPEVVREPIIVDQHRIPVWKSAIRAVKKELKWGKFLFHIHRGNRRSFTHPQWSVFSFRWYLIWKVFIAAYFVIWLGLSIAHFVRQYSELSTRVKWLLYLTNWTYLIFLLYLIVTAINVVRELVVKRQRRINRRRTWHFAIQWLLWNVGATATIIVCLVFWAFLVPTDRKTAYSASTVHVHLINAIVIVIDLWVNAMPMQLLHVYQPMIYGAAYATFSGVYFGVQKGTGPRNKPYVYPIVQDYIHHPAFAIGANFVMVFIVIPVVWVCLWLTYKLRVYLWENYDPQWRGQYDVHQAWEARFRGSPVQLSVISDEYDRNRGITNPAHANGELSNGHL